MREHSAQSWIFVLVTALLLSVIGLTQTERIRRLQGHQASVRDDADLWALNYRRAQKHGRNALALIGTSRMLYGLELSSLREAFPERTPIMLAANGAYPISTLHQLANDPKFKGDVLMDIDGRGLARYYFDMQQEYVAHAQVGVGPSTAINRRLQSQWQERAVIAKTELGIPAVLARRFFGAPTPFVSHEVMRVDRSASLDFQTLNLPIDAMRANFAQGVLADYQVHQPPSPDEFIADLAPVAKSLAALRAKGSRVWIFASPTNGAHAEADELGYPRARYWDRFSVEIAAPSGACAIHASDLPELSAIALPDSSHIDQRDQARYTSLLATAMNACSVIN
jgi:hypothetical protein